LLLHITSAKPFLQDGFIHRNIGFQPVMTDLIKAGFDIRLRVSIAVIVCEPGH